MSNRHTLDAPAVVFDNGSGFCKVGFSKEIVPRQIINSVVGHKRFNISLAKTKNKNYLIGNEALYNDEPLILQHPIERGQITDWDDMGKLWQHLFECELGVIPSEQPVLMTEPSLTPSQSREKMAEVMFENFKVPAFYLSNQAVVVLYASASVTGLVVDSGHGVTCTVPVFEGHALPHAVSTLNVSGNDLTEYLTWILLTRGYNHYSSINKAVVEDIKEKLCYVALDPGKEPKQSRGKPQKEYRLPDGNVICLGDQLYQVPEALFTPSQMDFRSPGIPEMIVNSIMKCDTDIQSALFKDIVLSGGTTLLSGFKERLFKELKPTAEQGTAIKITAYLDRYICGWVGASIMSSTSTFKDMWITSADFKEYGPSVIQRKCF
ncbi:actin-related protein T1-like [Echinops telfairi]|uniref:Actin-related protein T1-like n=1 Tax=Echinops telfairi TaxID=9371 RepID=A0ABM0J235_ECHTE|nr:actin-related protein T1-like [Echinops telfairi]